MEKAFENQPQVKAAETRILSAQKQTEIAKTAFYPSVSAFAGLSTFYFYKVSPTLNPATGQEIDVECDSFLSNTKTIFGQNMAFSANIPIFNKGITKLQVEQAKISESIAKNTLEQQKVEVQPKCSACLF